MSATSLDLLRDSILVKISLAFQKISKVFNSNILVSDYPRLKARSNDLPETIHHLSDLFPFSFNYRLPRREIRHVHHAAYKWDNYDNRLTDVAKMISLAVIQRSKVCNL
jgi:hypothetical protein